MVGEYRHISCYILMIILLGSLISPFASSNKSDDTTALNMTVWSEDYNLSNHTRTDTSTQISFDDINGHVIWTRQILGHDEIFYINTLDGGQNWNNEIQLSGNVSGIYCNKPSLTVGGENIHVVWNDNDAIGFGEVRYTSSSNGGLSWSPPDMITIDDGYKSWEPEISSNGSEIHLIWRDERHKAESIPFNTEIYYARSLDGGNTWDDGLGNIGDERRLTNAIYESYGQNIEVEGDAVHMIWADARDYAAVGDIYYKRSLDKGATWEDGLGNIDQDRQLTFNSTNSGGADLAVDDSSIHIVWTDNNAPEYYLNYIRSSDNGATWSDAIRLTSSNVTFNPQVVAEDGKVHVIWDDWRTNATKELYCINSTDGGLSWNDEVRITSDDGNSSAAPAIAYSNNRFHVSWEDQRDGNTEIYYTNHEDTTLTTPAQFNLSLTQGWNLISMSLDEPELNGISIYRASDIYNVTNCYMLSKWNPSSQTYTSYITTFHNPNDPENFAIGPDDAIFVWFNETANYTLTGNEPGSRNVHLLPGWNLVGYMGNSTGNVETDWAGQVQCGSLDDICYYTGTTFEHYIFAGTEMQLVPGRGYFVWSDVDTWLSY